MEIKKEHDGLKISLGLWEKLWSLHGDFSIPSSNLVSISEKLPQNSWWDIKFPGTFFPGVIKAGTYLTPRGKEFWYWVRNRKKIYTIELKNMRYKRLILASN